MTPNRIVALLTPLLFAPLAGSISALAAEYFPLVDVPTEAVEEIFIAGALIAFAKAAQWTHGWQKYEERESAHADQVEQLDAREAAIIARETEFAGHDLDVASEHAADTEGMVPEEDEWLAPDPELDGDEAFDDEPVTARAER